MVAEEEFGAGLAVDAVLVFAAGTKVEDVVAGEAVDDAGGCVGLGASTPAVAEPSPSFCKLDALILPVAVRLLSD